MTTIQQRDLHGLKALVTGATAGLGRAIAEAFVAAAERQRRSGERQQTGNSS